MGVLIPSRDKNVWKDNVNVYLNGYIVKNTDASSLKMLNEDADKYHGTYLVDENNVYYVTFDSIVKTILKPDSAVMLDAFYAKDNEHVVSDGVIIDGADADSFDIFSDITPFSYHRFGKDDDHIFMDDKILEGVDRDSFELIFDDDGLEVLGYKDKDGEHTL